MSVQKVLRSLSLRFDGKFYALEEMKDLDKLTMDELHGIFIAYETRTKKRKVIEEISSFKKLKEK